MSNWFSNINVKNKILITNSWAIGLLIIFGVIIYFTTNSLLNAFKWVEHTGKVIGNGHVLMEELLNMETGERGFLITGNKEFLEPYNNSISSFNRKINETKVLVQDNLEQVKRLDEIHILSKKWIEFAAIPEIKLRREIKEESKTFIDLQTILGKGEGKSILDKIRLILDELNNEFIKSNNQKAQTLLVAIGKDMVDQETGQRGFLITGDDEFFEPYRLGHKSFEENLEKLNLIVDNAFDRTEMAELIKRAEKLTKQWIEEVGEYEIDIRKDVNDGKKEFKAIEDVINSGVGKDILDQIRIVMDKMRSAFEISHNQLGVTLVLSISKNMLDQKTGQCGFLITGNDKFLEPFISGRKEIKDNINKLKNLVGNAYNIETTKRNIAKLDNLSDDWIEKAARPEIELRREINRTTTSLFDIQDIILGKTGKNIMDELRLLITDFISVENELIKKREESADASATNSVVIVVVGVIISILLIYFIGRLTAGLITNPIIVLLDSVNAVSSGDLSKKFEISSRDEIGNLALSMRNMVKSLNEVTSICTVIAKGDFSKRVVLRGEEDTLAISVNRMVEELGKVTEMNDRQSWIKTGQNKINERTRGELGERELGQNIITFLSTYLDAKIGSIYVINEQNEDLNYCAGYAVNNIGNCKDTVKLGEGLLGQASLAKKLIHVNEIPENYVRISSTMGDAVPRNLVIMPFHMNNQLIGVLELGFFKKVRDFECEFLSSVANSIAIMFNTAKVRENQQLLLEETQLQAEEMETQQEELRQANDAL